MDKSYQSLTRRLGKVAIIVSIFALILAVTVIVVLNSLKISFFSVSGNSMEPALSNKDAIVLKQQKKMAVDQLIFFNKPPVWTYNSLLGNEPSVLVKRIAAVPGDTLTFDGETFKVNKKIIFNLKGKNYPCELGKKNYKHKLKPDEVFVLGDNVNFSFDSRRVFCDGKEDFYVPYGLVIDYGTIAFKF